MIIDAEKLGAYLRRRREAMKLRRPAVARDIGVTSNYLGMVEAGKRLPSLPLLDKLTERLMVRPSQALAAVERGF